MIIARLFVGLGDTGIRYNKKEEIGTDKGKGTVLENGGVLRGLGTHFASQADKERYDQLVKQSNEVRTAFLERFVRVALFDSTFVISEIGEGKRFAEQLRRDKNIDHRVEIDVLEMVFSDVGEGISDKHLAEWATAISDQLKRIPLGRKKDTVSSDGLNALEHLADCPALDKNTAGEIRQLIARYRLQNFDKEDFKRSVALINVKVNKDVLSGPKRALPENISLNA